MLIISKVGTIRQSGTHIYSDMRRHHNLLLLLLLLLLTSCSSNHDNIVIGIYPEHADTSQLSQLELLRQVNVQKKDQTDTVNPIRAEGLKEAAMTVGAQGALARRSLEIDNILEHDKAYLDQVFNFNAFLMPHNVLPPVLAEAHNTLHLQDDTNIRIADRSFEIIKQARFVTVAPTWRDYLWLNYPKPDVPDKTLLPKNEIEVKIWQHYVQVGWEEGQLQANTIFSENVARLKRDYQGIAIYRKLFNQEMISAPHVAKSELGVVGGGDKMTINDQVLRITTLPSLNPQSEDWAPALRAPLH